jgi:CCT motif
MRRSFDLRGGRRRISLEEKKSNSNNSSNTMNGEAKRRFFTGSSMEKGDGGDAGDSNDKAFLDNLIAGGSGSTSMGSGSRSRSNQHRHDSVTSMDQVNQLINNSNTDDEDDVDAGLESMMMLAEFSDADRDHGDAADDELMVEDAFGQQQQLASAIPADAAAAASKKPTMMTTRSRSSSSSSSSKPPTTSSGSLNKATRSSSVSIPVPNPLLMSQQQQQQEGKQQGQGSSFGSSGSGFMTSVLNTTHQQQQQQQQQQSSLLLSHTPPTTLASSYEVSHFGKRARSGSVSGRLRSASEYLETKGLLDPTTKGILKDLIIIGDEVLQRALDQYESSGDATALEEMIRSGALQERLPQDLDLLGDLDLDFLTVQDHGYNGVGVDDRDATGAAHAGLGDENIEALPEHVVGSAIAAHPGMLLAAAHALQSDGIPMLKDDGIGELDFAGDFVDDHQPTPSGDAIGSSSVTTTSSYMEQQSHQRQHRQQKLPPSMASSPQTLTDYERRNRSNSLFTALWNTTTNPECALDEEGTTSTTITADGGESIASMSQQQQSQQNQQQQYGSWMQGYQHATADIDLTIGGDSLTGGVSPPTLGQGVKPQHATSSSIQVQGQDQQQQQQQQQQGIRIGPAPTKTGNPRGRPSNASKANKQKKEGGLGASLLEAERKRKEKEERKALREQKKLEKKEKKQKKKDTAVAAAGGFDVKMLDADEDGLECSLSQEDDDDGELSNMMTMHIPGSGRPRSLSDPNLRCNITDDGFRHVERPDGWVGAYSPDSRKVRISRFMEKRNHRTWTKSVKYDVRKNFADSRLRVKGRFVKKEDEVLMRELMSLT